MLFVPFPLRGFRLLGRLLLLRLCLVLLALLVAHGMSPLWCSTLRFAVSASAGHLWPWATLSSPTPTAEPGRFPICRPRRRWASPKTIFPNRAPGGERPAITGHSPTVRCHTGPALSRAGGQATGEDVGVRKGGSAGEARGHVAGRSPCVVAGVRGVSLLHLPSSIAHLASCPTRPSCCNVLARSQARRVVRERGTALPRDGFSIIVLNRA